MPLLVLVAIIWTDFIEDKFIWKRSQCCCVCISFVSIESFLIGESINYIPGY